VIAVAREGAWDVGSDSPPSHFSGWFFPDIEGFPVFRTAHPASIKSGGARHVTLTLRRSVDIVEQVRKIFGVEGYLALCIAPMQSRRVGAVR